MTVAAFGKVTLIHPLAWKSSQLLLTSPSAALAAVSPGGLSLLAVTPLTWEVMSPGMPVVAGPVTSEAFGAPSRTTSTVLVQSSGRWPVSKELAKAGAGSPAAAWANGTLATAGVATAATLAQRRRPGHRGQDEGGGGTAICDRLLFGGSFTHTSSAGQVKGHSPSGRKEIVNHASSNEMCEW